jgi:hypothetical protein
MLVGAFSSIRACRTISIAAASEVILSEASRAMARRASTRSRLMFGSEVKKSIVPMTSPSRRIGKQIAPLIPARRAIGARQQSVSSPMSSTWKRSFSRQARPLSPSPRANRAERVSRTNSASTSPESIEKTRAFKAASTTQYDPYDQPNSRRIVSRVERTMASMVSARTIASTVSIIAREMPFSAGIDE